MNNQSDISTFTVYLIDDKGNKWKEDDYEGYGVFGAKDFFELLEEMNPDMDMSVSSFYFYGPSSRLGVKYPMLVEDPNYVWNNVRPLSCPSQGFFSPLKMYVSAAEKHLCEFNCICNMDGHECYFDSVQQCELVTEVIRMDRGKKQYPEYYN